MVSRMMITGNTAAAWGARLAEVDYVPAFPITPQTEIIETLAEWMGSGELAGRFVTMDSEHSMMTAAGAAATAGVRVFTATSSQGLLYAIETMYMASGWRVPFVLVNVSRGIGTPLTLGPDHNDVLAARDTGFIQIHAETCQEVLDSVLMAYRIAEDPRVQLPVLVNLDGFFLSFTREPVEVPDLAMVRRFLPLYQPKHPAFRASQPVAQGVAVLDASVYSYFRYQMHEACRSAISVHAEASAEFHDLFGRRYDAVECYGMDDAEFALVMAGSFATKGKAAVSRWRDEGRRVGLVRLRLVRPRPTAALLSVLAGRKSVAVIDQNISPGLGGILFHELAGALVNCPERPRLHSFIGGLGGKDICQAEFDYILSMLESPRTETSPEPVLLFTEDEWQLTRARLKAAGKDPAPEQAAGNLHGVPSAAAFEAEESAR